MATANLPVPDQMNCADGEASANWEFFLEQWQNYNVATGLAKKDKEIQAATLATVMGRECYTVLKNLELTAAPTGRTRRRYLKRDEAFYTEEQCHLRTIRVQDMYAKAESNN